MENVAHPPPQTAAHNDAMKLGGDNSNSPEVLAPANTPAVQRVLAQLVGNGDSAKVRKVQSYYVVMNDRWIPCSMKGLTKCVSRWLQPLVLSSPSDSRTRLIP